MLVERENELHVLSDAIASATAADGMVVVVEGSPGIGKTVLLREAGRRAREAGLLALTASGTGLEREFPYGCARRMLEAAVRSAPESWRAAILTGPAALAAPAVLGLPAEPALPERSFAVLHGLYWLVADLAARQPLALILDDAHWADQPSLRFLGYLARRLDGLPVTVIASARPGEGEPNHELIGAMLEVPGARLLRPAQLTEAGVAAVLARALGHGAEPAVARACWEATGGNPFLVEEVAIGMAAETAEPTAATIERITAAAPARIVRATHVRLAKLRPEAAALGRAVAVLGADATLPRAAALAQLGEREALAALDALVAADLITTSSGIGFRHPILRSAVYDELSPGARSDAHRRVAERLRAEGAPLAAIAGHLLRSEPTGDLAAVATLRLAAAGALELGSPESAVRYLERALAEGPAWKVRTEILMELASAEKLARHPRAEERYAEAARLAEDPVVRAQAIIEQAVLLVYRGAIEQADTLIDAALAGLGGYDGPAAIEVITVRAAQEAFRRGHVSQFLARRPQLDALVDARAPGTRPLAMLLAGIAAQRNEPEGRAVALAEQGWAAGGYLADAESVELLPHGIGALIICDQLDGAGEMIEATRAAAVASGSVIHYLVAIAHSAWLNQQCGDFTMAAADLRASLEQAVQFGQHYAVVVTLGYCRDVLLERPDLEDVAAAVETIDPGQIGEGLGGAMFLVTRGSLRFAGGHSAAAIADLREAIDLAAALQLANPMGGSWRSQLALMLGRADAVEAHDMASTELAEARQAGQIRRAGVALRVLGVIEPDRDAGRAYLEEAATVLADSPARVEHARALVELGADLRRSGQRSQARQPLRDGLDLAARCGAIRLAERARTELVATGARPRRVRRTGRDALTPSELRVALLAAQGRRSREIAQALFVTTKTVDTHLNRTYSKLGINSRRHLTQALTAEASGPADAL